jgi:predicted MFS family arabinose efflux permease
LGGIVHGLFTTGVSREIYAVAIIAWSTIWSIGTMTGGYLYQKFGSWTPFVIASVIMILASFIALLIIREPAKRAE